MRQEEIGVRGQVRDADEIKALEEQEAEEEEEEELEEEEEDGRERVKEE